MNDSWEKPGLVRQVKTIGGAIVRLVSQRQIILEVREDWYKKAGPISDVNSLVRPSTKTRSGRIEEAAKQAVMNSCMTINHKMIFNCRIASSR